MILDDIKAALETVDPVVFYGKAGTLEDGDLWDYIVFSRGKIKTTGGKTGFAETYRVAIVRENFIPLETIEAVIEAMCGIDGMRVSDSEAFFDYATKPNTNTVVEILPLDFTKPRKRG